MDINALSQGVGLFSVALTTLKQAIDILPDSPNKSDAKEALEKAYRELKIAESEVANNLKYEICRNHFPPEIMLSKNDIKWTCPVCHNMKTKPTGSYPIRYK